MSSKKNVIAELIRKQVLILDGALGTQLQRRGMPQGCCPELWCAEHPDIVQAIHRDYVRGGAHMVYSATFGANRIKLAEYGGADVGQLNTRLAAIARHSGAQLVCGDIGPTGQFVEPFGPLLFDEAVAVFKEQIRGLLQAGVDALVIETMMDIQEARAALIAARELSDIFVLVTMTFESDGRTLNGTDAVSALLTLQSLGADAVGANCSGGPRELLSVITAMSAMARVPLAVKPNAGMPTLAAGTLCYDIEPEQFAAFGPRFLEQGVAFLGGCCGTTPAHIAALSAMVGHRAPPAPRAAAVAAVSGPRGYCRLGGGQSLVVVGECINPTGKKQLQQSLRARDYALARTLAQEQQAAGAALLDVNAGIGGDDEPAVLRELVLLLSVISTVPLVIDSTHPEALAAALRVYPGRALINSISGERNRLEEALALAARYGAMFVALPLTEQGIPDTVAQRRTIIRRIARRAAAHGFALADMVVDGLAMTVAAQPQAAQCTLDIIEWCARRLGIATVIGLSNVSFGLPARPVLNATFLAMARSRGLSMVIANPRQDAVMNAVRALDVLCGVDRGAAKFIEQERAAADTAVPVPTATPEQQVAAAIQAGARETIIGAVQAALAAHVAPQELLRAVMVPAINQVGELFSARQYFLPQLLASAETMKAGVGFLRPYLAAAHAAITTPDIVIVLATVRGDIHDIGKNIVALLLENQGFRVVDLGKDVDTQTIVDAAASYPRVIIGLSALMTTTMAHMPEVISALRQRNIAAPIMVGGAAVTGEFARQIGAVYGRDGVAAVTLARELAAQADISVS